MVGSEKMARAPVARVLGGVDGAQHRVPREERRDGEERASRHLQRYMLKYRRKENAVVAVIAEHLLRAERS